MYLWHSGVESLLKSALFADSNCKPKMLKTGSQDKDEDFHLHELMSSSRVQGRKTMADIINLYTKNLRIL